MGAPYTVEVFHDAAFDKVDTEFLHDATSYMGGIVCNAITIVGDQRRMRLGSAEADRPLEISNVHLPRLPADINVILTPRPLRLRGEQIEQRYASTETKLSSRGDVFRTIYIDTTVPTPMRTLAVHELGHAFGLKRRGLTADAALVHCTLEHCAMYPYHRPEKTQRTLHTLCDDCSSDVAQMTYFESQYRQGKNVPASLYFPIRQ